MQSRVTTDYWNNKEYTQKECLALTKKHRKTVKDMMDIFCRDLKQLWEEHDKDKEKPKNLKKYTYLLNHPQEKEINEEWKKIHNHNNTHHVEWFLACERPTLQHLVEMTCDEVAAAIGRDAKYDDIYEENKKRYIEKWLSKDLATICTNTFIDLWNSAHKNK